MKKRSQLSTIILVLCMLLINCSRNKDYPLNVSVNEYSQDENKLSIYVITQNTSEEKVEFNLYAIKLTGEDGSEVGPDIMDTRAPSFPVNKSLNKGDKASGWLNFEIPSSSFRPEKLEFQKLMSSDNYGVLDVKGMLAGKDVGDKFEEITISSTQGSVPDYPLNSTIKDLNQNETNFRIYIVTENTSEEKVEFNLYAIKLVGEDGSELGVDLFDNQEPSFPVNKSLNKGDEAAGWLSFEIPSSSFKPKKLEFRKLMSSDKYDVIRMDSDEAVVKKKSIEKKRLEEEAEVIAATVLHAQANYSLDFGGDGTVNMGDVLDMSGDFSISAWVVTDGSYKMIVMKRGQHGNVVEKTYQGEQRASGSSCNISDALVFAQNTISHSGRITNGPTLGMEPVGCSYYFWANVMSPYGTPKTVHITVSAESGAWEVIAVEVK